MAVTMTQYMTGATVQLVSVCAWCPRRSYVPLRKGQEYTHGICVTHLKELREDLKRRRLQC